MSSFNEQKKRRVDGAVAVGINSTPSNKDIVTLLCENITTTEEQDGFTWCMSDCPAHNDGRCRCMVKWKKGCRPRAVNTCKWTEKASTTRSFVRLFDDLTELTINENSKIDFDTRRAFKVKSDKYSKQWDAFAQLHGMLQEDGLARNKGQQMINMLHNTIALYREKQGSPFKDCELKNDHSKLGNKHETDHAFSRAVDKIQNKKEHELTNHEKDSCKGLLK